MTANTYNDVYCLNFVALILPWVHITTTANSADGQYDKRADLLINRWMFLQLQQPPVIGRECVSLEFSTSKIFLNFPLVRFFQFFPS